MSTKNIRFKDKDDNTLLPLPCNILKTTYAKLKAMRDAGSLTKGMRYRITDYQCTTTQESTQSAGHQFDIIVTALSESKLSEKASAMLHDGDTYFANSNLSAWRLLYSLDNDTSLFSWADSANGKGVVYGMIDEYGNDLPYDFKNIMFKRSYSSFDYLAIPGIKLYYDGKNKNQALPGQDDAKSIFCYTFSCLATAHEDSESHEQLDASVGQFPSDLYGNDEMTRPYGNVIKPYFVMQDEGEGTKTPIRKLQNIVFLQRKDYAKYYYVYANYIGSQCHDISFNAIDANGNFLNGKVENCIFAGEATINNVTGEVQNCLFSEDTNNNIISGYVQDACFGNDVANSHFGGPFTKTSVKGGIYECNFSGRVDGCTFSQSINSSVFSSETLLCTFSGIVDSCTFEGLCNGYKFPGNSDNYLQYVRQVGFIYIQSAKNKGNLPTIAIGAKYPQILTSDAEENVVVKTL